MKYRFFFFILFLNSLNVFSQNKYWITFTDKAGVTFDPYSYFSERTIIQRLKSNIPLADITDYPLNAEYVNSVVSFADSVSWQSRWLNGIALYASEINIELIRGLPFVSDIEQMNSVSVISAFSSDEFNLTESAKKLLAFQTARMKGASFKENNFDGEGIRIAVFDVGFSGVDKSKAFAHLRDGKKIISTYDFVSHDEDVYHGHWHGEATLSCIAGKTDSLNIGLATGAEFLLARTERLLSERFSEEENWLAAAEWADKQGANIISSSLGYTNKRYFKSQMDGRTSLVSRAATMAAHKGILVVNSAGNEGNDPWHVINTPSDADSVLTVGGTNAETDMHIYFSSYGPASDGSLKPNVCSLGEVIAAKGEGLSKVAGTSFSTPLVAGFAACAWQSHRSWSNMDLFNAIEKSSHLYPYYDYAHGFGIPQAEKILSDAAPSTEPTFDFVIINNDIKVILREQFSYPDTEESLGFSGKRNFYYKIEDKDGKMKKYFVLLAENKEMLHFFAESFANGDIMTIHFEGYTSSLDIAGEIK